MGTKEGYARHIREFPVPESPRFPSCGVHRPEIGCRWVLTYARIQREGPPAAFVVLLGIVTVPAHQYPGHGTSAGGTYLATARQCGCSSGTGWTRSNLEG